MLITGSTGSGGSGGDVNVTNTDFPDAAAEATLTSIDGHVDGLETLAGSTNTKLDSLHTDNGAAGASPASGTGILGFLRSIYDKLASTLAVTQSGTWTVQPGNTANTTAWKVDGSAVTQPVSGPLTDAQLRATAVPVSGTVTATTGGLTDAQLRATAVPVSGTVTASNAAGDVANAATDSGNPVKVGGKARTTQPTAVTDAQRVDALFDKLGKLIVAGSLRALKAPQTTTITASTAETTIGTANATDVLDLYGLIITNTSATSVNVIFKDATAGTMRMTFAVPANTTVGFTETESGAWKQATANNNWTATVSASVTSIIISAFLVQNVG